MPNGGSDCCGTCWFNSKNNGEQGYHGSEKEGVAICTIRNLEIPDPFWTYCANHPHHNQNKIDLQRITEARTGSRSRTIGVSSPFKRTITT